MLRRTYDENLRSLRTLGRSFRCDSLSLRDLIPATDTLEIHTGQQHCVYFHGLFLCIV